MAIARFSIAIDRPPRRDGTKETDFPNIVVFGKQAENCEKYLVKGRLVAIEGRIQTGSYTNKDGQKVYTTDVVVERHEFVDSKSQSGGSGDSFVPAPGQDNMADSGDGFMNIPDGIDEELPFS